MKPGLLSFDEALAQLMARAVPVEGTELVPTIESAGRVLAQDQRSTLNVPPMDNTERDGYALRCADLGTGGPGGARQDGDQERSSGERWPRDHGSLPAPGSPVSGRCSTISSLSRSQ